jgi:cbb3-type cytochrome oxidase cytochrome c subunit
VKRGPFIFLAAFFALSSSWCGFVLTPQLQLGRMQPTNTIGSAVTYPVARPGQARQGLEVYRANGCAACHTQQTTQSGSVCEVLIQDPGTNRPVLLAAMVKSGIASNDAEAEKKLAAVPGPVAGGLRREDADQAVKALSGAGAKASVWIVPTGPDMARGWGKRGSVAEDFLYDSPVQPGAMRIGPDLANIGLRQSDANWHLRHLYAPTSEVKGSTMPPYRFLFEVRKVERQASNMAITLAKEYGPPAGYEVVPKPEAQALVAYLLSLKSDAPLFVAPLSVASAPAPSTNNPTGGATNAPANPPAGK